MRKVRTSILLAVLWLAAPSLARAAPVSVDFSFANTQAGGITGIVTGEIDFAQSGTNVSATGLYVLTAPANVTWPFPPAFNLVSISSANQFTVSDAGEIANASFYSHSGIVIFSLNYFNVDQMTGQYGNVVRNGNGFSGVTFTPALVAVTEPSDIAVFLSGMLGLVMLRRRAGASFARGASA